MGEKARCGMESILTAYLSRERAEAYSDASLVEIKCEAMVLVNEASPRRATN
jgi:hypothetical protein